MQQFKAERGGYGYLAIPNAAIQGQRGGYGYLAIPNAAIQGQRGGYGYLAIALLARVDNGTPVIYTPM